jgi:hypothetical protein
MMASVNPAKLPRVGRTAAQLPTTTTNACCVVLHCCCRCATPIAAHDAATTQGVAAMLPTGVKTTHSWAGMGSCPQVCACIAYAAQSAGQPGAIQNRATDQRSGTAAEAAQDTDSCRLNSVQQHLLWQGAAFAPGMHHSLLPTRHYGHRGTFTSCCCCHRGLLELANS